MQRQQQAIDNGKRFKRAKRLDSDAIYWKQEQSVSSQHSDYVDDEQQAQTMKDKRLEKQQ